MNISEIDFTEWQQRFGNEAACIDYLARLRWPDGFRCPKCNHDHGYRLSTRGLYECASCHRQTSVTAGTMFHSTNLPLTKWFSAIYLDSTQNGGLSALGLAKSIGVTWRTARSMLTKLRTSLKKDADGRYQFQALVGANGSDANSLDEYGEGLPETGDKSEVERVAQYHRPETPFSANRLGDWRARFQSGQ